MKAILPIVEGHAETESVPVLLRRLFTHLGLPQLQVSRPFRVKRNRIVRPGEIERAIEQAVRDRQHVACILVVIDADDDCPEQLTISLLQRARSSTNLPVAVVSPVRELEAWFLGAKQSLRGVRGIRLEAGNVHEPENIRGAKERLTENMCRGRRYLEVDDQPAFAQQIDLEMARRHCSSFDKFCRDVLRLVTTVSSANEETAE